MAQAGIPGQVPVGALMHRGLINCPPQTPLAEVAAQMAEHGVHCMVVEGLARRRGHGGGLAEDELVWGIVSDRDLIRAAAAGDLDADVSQIAATEIVTVAADEPLERAIQLMSEHDIAHLVVLEPLSGEPAGVISTLDVAARLAAEAEGEHGSAVHSREEARHG